MNPVLSDVHVDIPLSNVSTLYRNVLYKADGIAPMVPVDKESNKYYIFNKGDMFRSNAAIRADGTPSKRHGFRLSTSTYYTDEIAISTEITDRQRKNADSILRLEQNKTMFVTDQILLKYEQMIASLCTTVANWGTNYSTPSVTFDNYETSDPVSEFETAIGTVEDNTGQPVNKIAISKDVWKILKHHPQLLERMPSTTMRTATVAVLVDILSNDTPIDIQICGAMVNTAVLGQTDSFSQIWSGDIWVGHVAPAPAPETPTALYTFVLEENGMTRGVRTWRDENIHSDVYEAYMNCDAKVVGSDLGYVMKTVIS